ncbi:MAG: alpha/beta hydrolase [Xanthomonadales bacterium]|nr:alpha/beta hydrolase [Xanthomonadales bacterium]
MRSRLSLLLAFGLLFWLPPATAQTLEATQTQSRPETVTQDEADGQVGQPLLDSEPADIAPETVPDAPVAGADSAVDIAAEEALPEPFAIAADGSALDTADLVAPTEIEWLRQATADTVVCPFRGAIDYEDGEIECGLIQVPENREVAGSRMIELHFVRLVATGEDKRGKPVQTRPDPVIYLTGGPGVAVSYYVGKLKDHRLLEQRDLYILEQRGIGYSSSFCPFFGSRNRADQVRDNFADHQRLRMEQAIDCARRARAQGVDLRGYNTIENARDVRALRQALGLERWNVWGISYGSALGQAVARIDADGVQAMVIDAIVPLDIAELMRMPSWYQRGLDRLAEACASQPACNDAWPDLVPRYLAAIQSVLAEPFALEVEPSEMYPDGKAYIFADIVAGLPFSLLYEQSTHPAIPAIIAGLTRAVETRDPILFKGIASAMGLETPGTDQFGAGMAMAIRCQDGYVEQMVRVAQDEHARHPLLAAALLGDVDTVAAMAQTCAEQGMGSRDPALYAPLRSDLPIVVANGAWDPITPTPLAEYIMSGLSHGRLVEFPHAGHGPTRSLECGGEFLNRFFDDPQAELDMDCVNDGEQAATYLAPYFATSALPRLAILAAESKKQVVAHGAWGGVSLAISLIGLLLLVFAWLARKLDRRERLPGSLTRWLAGLTALASVGFVAGLGTAAGLAFEVTPALLLFGLHDWARWLAWLGPAAGVLGLVTVVVAVLSAVPRASRIGFVMVGLAGISLSVFGWYWHLWPI